MDSDPQSALGHINRGIDAQEDGNTDVAKRHFAQALLAEPGNEIGWLWLAEASVDPGEKLYCLNRAVEINPDSNGRLNRDRLRATKASPVVPPAIGDLERPPVPPSFRRTSRPLTNRVHITPARTLRGLKSRLPASQANRGNIFSNRWTWMALGLLAIAITGFVGYTIFRDDHETIYIAVVGPMSGPNDAIGTEMERGARIAAEDYNRTTKGAHVSIVIFDDKGEAAEAEEQARKIVSDDRIVAVVGHGSSTTSLAAAPIYNEAHIAVISAQATSDRLADFPNYFRTIFSNTTEAHGLSVYLQDVLKQKTISMIVGPGEYERSLGNAISPIFAEKGTIKSTWQLTADNRDASIQAIVDGIKADPESGTIFLALTEVDAHDVLIAIRRAGLNPMLFGSESVGTERFALSFSDEPEEIDTPGYFTEGMYAASPLIYDGVGSDTLAFARKYQDEDGMQPGWRAAKIWDALTAVAVASDRGDVKTGTRDMSAKRQSVIDQLHAIDTLDKSFRGLAGPLYFTSNGDSPQAFSIGMFQGTELISAPTQYRLVTNTTQYNMDNEVSAGRAIQVGEMYFRQYRVAYVGIDMIEVRDLDTSAQSYKADFFLFMRYNGDDAPLDIVFTNSTDSGLSLGEPLNESVTSTGMNYRLYRVQGTFSEPMNFMDYPWDTHSLTIRFQNPTLKQTDLVYVPDPATLETPMEDRLASRFDRSRPFNRVPSWNVSNVEFEQMSITSSADDYDTKGVVQYSEFRVVIDMGRDVNSFLVKNLLPLALLALVTYIALWFPAEQAGTRVGFAITALLSSSVMLGSISSRLPDIGYTVAIEWGYYAYIGLSAILVLLNIAVDKSFKSRRFARAKRLDTFIRTMYPLAILATVAVYWTHFH